MCTGLKKKLLQITLNKLILEFKMKIICNFSCKTYKCAANEQTESAHINIFGTSVESRLNVYSI